MMAETAEVNGLVGPGPSEMKEGETYKVVKEGDKWRLEKVEVEEEEEKEVHVTTLAGPQAEELLKLFKGDWGWTWRDKSVPGLAVVELWRDA